MDFITCIILDLSGPTKILLSSLAFVAFIVAFIAYDLERNHASEIIERRAGDGFIDHGDLWKALKMVAMKRGSDHSR